MTLSKMSLLKPLSKFEVGASGDDRWSSNFRAAAYVRMPHFPAAPSFCLSGFVEFLISWATPMFMLRGVVPGSDR